MLDVLMLLPGAVASVHELSDCEIIRLRNTRACYTMIQLVSF